MRPLCTVLCFVSVLLVCGSAYADKVNVDWDRQANFQQYKTYAWVESPNPPEDPLMARRIVQAVDGQLSAKGLQRVEPGQDPDLSVIYDSGVRQKVSWVPAPAWGWYGWYGGPGPGYGLYWGAPAYWGGPAWGWWDAPYTYYPLVEDIGTLAVTITDEHQKQAVWHGVASDALKDNPEKNARKICELIAKMFRKYPPPGCCGHVSRSTRSAVVEREHPILNAGQTPVIQRAGLQVNIFESAESARFISVRPWIYPFSREMDLRS